MATGRGIIGIPIQHHAFQVTFRLERRLDEALWCVWQFAIEGEFTLQFFEQGSVLIFHRQSPRPANVDAFETTRTFPRIDNQRVKSARSGMIFFRSVEEWPRFGNGQNGNGFRDAGQIALHHSAFDIKFVHGIRDQLCKGFAVYAGMISSADRGTDGADIFADHLALGRWHLDLF